MTTAEREEAHTQAESCQSMLAKAFESRRNVGHMVGAMARAGCAIDPVEFVQCRPCDADVHIGGAMYGADSGHMEIVMCEGKLRGQKHFNETLTHELIHAYDFCRAEVDETNCRHHACTEIRAANLSHDCSYANEVARGKGYFLRDQHDKCVRRRAMLSVQANPNCSEAQCEQAVDEVWTRCISDVAPFGSVPF
jgi:inner membrane protease ATP23